MAETAPDDAKIDKVLALFIIIIIISVITRDDYTHIYTAADPCEPWPGAGDLDLPRRIDEPDGNNDAGGCGYWNAWLLADVNKKTTSVASALLTWKHPGIQTWKLEYQDRP